MQAAIVTQVSTVKRTGKGSLNRTETMDLDVRYTQLQFAAFFNYVRRVMPDGRNRPYRVYINHRYMCLRVEYVPGLFGEAERTELLEVINGYEALYSGDAGREALDEYIPAQAVKIGGAGRNKRAIRQRHYRR